MTCWNYQPPASRGCWIGTGNLTSMVLELPKVRLKDRFWRLGRNLNSSLENCKKFKKDLQNVDSGVTKSSVTSPSSQSLCQIIDLKQFWMTTFTCKVSPIWASSLQAENVFFFCSESSEVDLMVYLTWTIENCDKQY